jgi:hypothetical protein
MPDLRFFLEYQGISWDADRLGPSRLALSANKRLPFGTLAQG